MLHRRDLDRLAAAWRAQGAPTPGSLAPGLSEAELDAYAAELGFGLPGDLRVWWGWHNGAVDGVSSLGAAVGVTWYLMSLPEALEERARRLAWNNPAEFPDDAEDWQGQWAPWWLPVVTFDAACLFADLRAPAPDGSVPVHVWSEVPDAVFEVLAPSWADVVNGWAQGIEQGHLRYSTADGQWDVPGWVPPQLRPFT
ncbi:SMI1/KNR4 family protein [Actinoplanes sp. NPDC026623]|uniref:SMI1/KNR4 family protein n=1 Tax=Actinoplanes sp. NPDC026623 TaxID=3155610 RepID=UPI0034078772